MAKRDHRKGTRGRRPKSADAPPREGADPPPPDERGGDREDVEIAAVELVTALARLDLQAALAHEAAAARCEDGDLERNLRDLARDHRVHVEALNEALEAEGEPAVTSPPEPRTSVLAGLVAITGPLGGEVVVVTLLGAEQLTNLAYDASLSYEWDDEVEAMLRRFQQDEERHLSWLAERHDALGGHASSPDAPS
jgi:rubrerythrin